MIAVLLLPAALAAVIVAKRSIMKGVIIFNAFLFMTTEILSLLNMVTPLAAVAIWSIFTTVFIALSLKDHMKIKAKKPAKPDILFIIPAVLSLILLFPALYTVPYNVDSMCYHLPRIMFWVQNRSVSYYATNDMRQLVTSPFTEYVQMQTMLLGGEDRFFNMISYFAGIISIYLISSLVFRITHSKVSAAFSGLLYVTTPVIESEMISTQVDVMAGMWVMICISLIYDLGMDGELKCNREGIYKILYLAVSMGLLFVSKTNACIPVAVMLIWLLYKRIAAKDGLKSIIVYLSVCMSALVFALPSFIRNFKLCGDFLASDYMGDIAVGSFLPAFLIVNALKNAVMAGVLSNVPDSPVRSFQLMIVKASGKVFGVDINDPRISFVSGETAFQDNTGLSYEHDHAGAQFLLILFMILLVCFLVISIKNRSVDSFVLFTALQVPVVFMTVRWQPWVGRLLIPSFVIMIVFCGCIIGYISRRNVRTFKALIILGAIVSCFIYYRSYAYNLKPALLNIRGEYTRNQLYYYNHNFEDGSSDKHEAICKKAIEYAQKANNQIGLMDGTFVYPDIRILRSENIRVENINPEWEVKDFYPDIIMVTGSAFKPDMTLSYNGNDYCLEYSTEEGRYSLLRKK